MSEITLLHGDNRDVLKTLADQSVNTCVTSPPYFGLRDYGSAQWVDGVIPDCQHSNAGPSPLNPKVTVCWDCSAVKEDKQIGLEETPEEYVAALVEVFREVKRVLRDDGTLWLNLGDSYNTQPAGNSDRTMTAKQKSNHGSLAKWGNGQLVKSLPPKNLIGIPWRVAFALQSDGWILRSDIIWSKPNAMPESVTDRPTKSHEYIFLFSKQQKYYYDNEAIKESNQSPQELKDLQRHYTLRPNNGATSSKGTGAYRMGSIHDGRNKRSVWTVASQPYSGAHYAVFPEKLIEPCILAGCPEGGTVLDPFAGSGTTGRVAVKNRRNATLIELNPEYHKQIEKRTDGVQVRLF